MQFFKPRPILLWTILVLVLSWSKATSQVHYRFFYGKILTTENRKPLANVNISFEKSKMGSVTDQQGSFSFYIDTIPTIMIVSHVGYKTKRILLDGTSNSMTLYLDRDIQELQAVDIKPNTVEPFFKNEHFTLRDYEIDSNLVYLLVYRNRVSKEELICENLEGDTISRSGILFFTPTSLYRDCLGSLHVESADTVYQINRLEKGIHMILPVEKNKFDAVMNNCIASTDKVLFFKKATNLGQGVQYYGIDRTSKKRHELSQVVDEKKAKMLRRNPEDAWDLMSAHPDYFAMLNDIDRTQMPGREELKNQREAFDNWSFANKIIYRPVKSALYKVENFICIFNVPDKQLEFYDLDGNFSYKLKINVETIKEGRWSGDIYFDENQSKVYTTFLKSSGTGLYRIDLNTGDLHKTLTLVHPYPQKIRIYKSKVYYMYSILGDADNKVLYRQDL